MATAPKPHPVPPAPPSRGVEIVGTGLGLPPKRMTNDSHETRPSAPAHPPGEAEISLWEVMAVVLRNVKTGERKELAVPDPRTSPGAFTNIVNRAYILTQDHEVYTIELN